MESANLHQHHHLQQQFGGCFLAAQSGYGVSITHDTIPTITWNSKDHNVLLNEIHPNLRVLGPKNDFVLSPAKTSLIQDLGFCDPRSFAYQSANVLQLRKIKEEILDCFPKFNNHDQPYVHHDPNDENLWLSPFSSNGETGRQNLSAKELHSKALSPARFGGVAFSNSYNFSHVFPSTNISNQDLSLLVSSSSGLNVPVLDLLISTNHGESCSQSSHDNFGLIEESMSLGHDYMQESSTASPSSSSNKASATRNDLTTAKRLYSLSEPKASHEPAKKSRNISKFSCAPFKVRKNKLGDRIAALHRLVAPFGKTDTASVLTEAIGYIQFLQDQIQTLSVPYMKSPQSKPYVTIQQSSSVGGGELLQDLRSRGLCLVPKSLTSYISSRSEKI